MKKLLTIQLLLIVFFCNKSFSQSWIDTWQNENNFYTIQKAFNKFNEKHEREERRERRKKEEMGDDDEGAFPGYIQYKRWESFVEQRVYPSGDISLLKTTSDNYQKFLAENNYSTNPANGKMATTWTAMGPFGNLTGLATNGLPRKAGRINFITLDPSNPNTFWVGAPAGGLWKTTDGGITWNIYNDNIAEIGCTDLAIDPTNSNIMYLATGDGYASFRNPGSIGVYKTTDGGITWSPTGLVFSSFPKIEVRHIIVNPVNPLIVIASTSNGIYRTTNGGVGGWSQVDISPTYDLEFKTSNPDTVYASGKTFKRSINAGLSFTTIAAGIPTTGSQRMEIALTPANPNVVYVCSTTNTTYGLQGVYRSTNSGTSFTLMASTPDILASDCIVTTTSGQGWYDLAFDASPLNQNELVAGGLGAWKSLDGGATWSQIGCGYSLTSTPPYVHTDHQEFEYSSTGVLYGVNDGGVTKYTGTTWTDLSDPMNIAQIFKIGLSSLTPSLWITGHQDNGSNIHNSTTYKASLAADGTDNFIDRTNDLNMYASISAGSFYKSTNGGASWNSCTTGIGPASGFITPWKQDPVVATTLYAGRAQMYKSINSASSWTALASMTGVVAGQFVTEFAVAPSNTQYMYAIHGTTGMFVSTNGGTSWVLRNTGISTGLGALTFVTIDPTNEQVAYATQSGYSSGYKVYKTTNAGALWTNISYNLPNLPANCSVFETGNVDGRIYIGMDVGVYYIDNVTLAGTTPLWTPYNAGLPNTPVMDMEISPAAPTKITLATFGRGVYQADIVPSPFPPVSAFNYSGTSCTMPNTVVFNDISTNSPTSWIWTVSPSAGVTISLPSSQNPTITFTNPGTYTVSLTATNSFGTGSLSTQVIAIGPPVIGVSASATTICTGQNTTLTATGGASYTWLPGGLSGSSVVVSPASSQTYTVVCTGTNGCVANTTIGITVTICTGIIGDNEEVKFSVYPNPANDVLNINIGVDKLTDFEFEITNVFGQEVLKREIKISPDKTDEQLNISPLANGIYFLKINSNLGSSQAIKIIKN